MKTRTLRFALLTGALLALFGSSSLSASDAGSKFRKLNKDGTGNMVFSSTNIVKGEEEKSELKTIFKEGESIYARAYFSTKLGELEGEEEGFIDLWIDGKHQKRLGFTNKDIAADKDQTLIYVYNTTDYSPDFNESLFSDLTAGEHKIRLIVGKTKFVREGASLRDQGDTIAVVQDDVHKAVYLSDSSFTFIKN